MPRPERVSSRRSAAVRAHSPTRWSCDRMSTGSGSSIRRGDRAINYWKSEYLAALADGAIDAIGDAFARMTSPDSDIKVVCLGGAIADVAPDDTAYTHRHAQFILNINTRWVAGDAAKHVEWTRTFWNSVRPYSAGGVYVNFL